MITPDKNFGKFLFFLGGAEKSSNVSLRADVEFCDYIQACN